MCHVKLLLASRVGPIPLRGVLTAVVQNARRNAVGNEKPPLSAKSTPMQWFFSALYHDIKKSNIFLLSFLGRFHHCAQLPTDTKNWSSFRYSTSLSFNYSGIYSGLYILKRIKCAVTQKTT